MTQDQSPIVVCALYKFVTLEKFQDLRQPLLKVMEYNNIRGTLLLASEGINGTVAGNRKGIDRLMAWFEKDGRLGNIVTKESFEASNPFYRTKVKLKKEIVTMGIEGIDPKQVVGTYIKPKDWNALISDPDVVLVDTRNDYEVKVGTFEGALNPNTTNFREFPQYVSDNLDPKANKKVAMFCTGGIRCEKSTAYLKEQGFDEVYHLQGGILKYLEEVPEEDTMWQGECFVFDNRVTVNHQLEKGQYDQCHACRLPITKEEQTSDKFLEGISCPYCFDKHTPDQRQRYQERQRQMQLAQERGEAHIGADAIDTIAQRRQAKAQEKQDQRDK
ncbi:rhodanese-related sulfurtransferase [Candidatus Njordibacter sp. Uisw_039]|jgi:UPF0176 protein|uniref:oxygen-dependent tRNA uridine(34) hydroxylase TrhO n=1 Tax=Candidatus Njordibacter sp. Uisw_039 TaxID=3230972 RepID=UPI003A44AA86|tara:strand:- start:1537 stop:2526 length:990 start_codon:yes stop_codon:yes gene_type:complete